MKAVFFHGLNGVQAAVMAEPGRKFTHIVVIDHPVHRVTLLNDTAKKYSRDMPDVTVQQLSRRMLAAGRRMGITKGARALLKEGGHSKEARPKL